MKIRYKEDFYNHRFDKLLPHILKDKYMEYKFKKLDRFVSPMIDAAICEYDSQKPNWIEIETVSRCNGTCGFCPVNIHADPRPRLEMSDELFKSIIDQLHDLKYDGLIALFCNNEPLLDKKLVERLTYANRQLPDAFHYLYSNGKALTPKKFEAIAPLLDVFIIDNYSTDNQMTSQIKLLYDLYKDKYDNVYVWMRRIDELWSTRGGHSPNRKKITSPLKSSCILPFQHCYIRPDGKISLCCQDALWSYEPLGDLNKQTFIEVWNGAEYAKLREHFKNGGSRSMIKVCRDCDFLTTGKHREDIWAF